MSFIAAVCLVILKQKRETSGCKGDKKMRLRNKVLVGTVVLGMSLLALAGCGGKSEPENEVQELNVQFVPTNNDGSMEAKAKPFAEYLTEKLGCPVKET